MSRKLVSWGGVISLFAAALIGAECRLSGAEPEPSAKPVVPQVMLHVRVIEADRKLLAETFDRLSSDSETKGGSVSTASGQDQRSCICPHQAATKAIDELIKHKKVRVVAEPTLTVLSGHEAKFLAGGEFPVAAVVGVGDSSKTVTSSRFYGLLLNAKPTVIDAEWLELELCGESSQIKASTSATEVPELDSRRLNTTVRLHPEGQSILMTIPATPTAPTQAVRKKDAQASRGLLCLVTPELVKPRLDDSGRVAAPASPLLPSAATPTITPPPVAPGYLVTPTSPLYQPMPFAADTPAQLRDLVFRHTSPFQPQPRGQGVPPDWHSPAFVPELFDHIGGWHPLSEVSPSLGQGHPSSPAARPLVPIPGRLEHAGAWDLPRPSIERTRLDELRAALTHLEAAGLKENAEQVRREIKLEERAAARRELDQKERDLETLKKQIELLRQSVNEPGIE